MNNPPRDPETGNALETLGAQPDRETDPVLLNFKEWLRARPELWGKLGHPDRPVDGEPGLPVYRAYLCFRYQQ